MLKKIKIFIMILILILWIIPDTGCKLSNTVSNPSKNIEARYQASGHADSTSEAFRHWDEDDPPLVPTNCAKCHSGNGFLDFIDNGKVDTAAEPEVITCEVCHLNSETGVARGLDSVTFPSGETIEGLGIEAICMQCHQGRASTTSVNGHISDAGAVGDDVVNVNLGFQNVHYAASGATMFGTLAQGGYQYSDKTYDANFSHVKDYTACNTCHDPHSLKIRTERCGTCHTNIKSDSDLRDIRYLGSLVDYDGDGSISEGVYHEITTMENKLSNGIKAYAKNIIGIPIGYESHTHPYFFNDTNEDGVIDESEAVRANMYATWTPRLLKAAYNYQYSKKDPGAFAHGGKYVIQLLFDSIENLDAAAGFTLNLAGLHRGDEGHFDGSSEAWRHWDEDGEVSASCARCHSAGGLPYFIANGEDIAQPICNGMLCTTCHDSPPGMRQQDSVTFPSGAVLDIGDSSNSCLNCHQGRASKVSIDDKIKGGAPPYSFTNIHYFPAAAVFFGTEARGGYEYTGKAYTARKIFPNHEGSFDTCIECHMGTKTAASDISHNVHKVNKADCVSCHGQDPGQTKPGANPKNFEFSGIRPGSTPDYDGDGNKDESIKSEIQGLETALYARMQAYANAIGSPIIYDINAYPYFFNDTNGNGLVDPGEATRTNGYSALNAALLKGAYNLHLSKKEPAGYIHNSKYVAQLLVDSIINLGGNAATYSWR
jgi:hypothetical protein